MKALFLSAAIGLLLSGAVFGQTTIWAPNLGTANLVNDFDTTYYAEAVANTPSALGAGTDEWRHTNGTLNPDVGETGKAGMFVNSSGQSRGISYVLDSSFFPGPGTYTFNYEIWVIYSPTTLNVAVYEASGVVGGDSYTVDNANPLDTELAVIGEGAATVALLNSATYNRDQAGGDVVNREWNARSLSFTYSGDGKDVVLHFWGRNIGQTTTSGDSFGFTIGGDLSITGEGASSDPLWAGFPVEEDGYVDTGDFLGWVWVGNPQFPSPWVWISNLQIYVYLPAENVDPEAGAWTYAPQY